ncbi:MAG: hypothetical protein ACTSUF_03585 [Candidatus Heimdallarchaeaceae archaeon]
MAKPDKKNLVKIYCCNPNYLFESMTSKDNPNPPSFKNLVIDFSLNEEIARKCMKLKLDYIGCSPNEKRCIALKKKLGFKDGYATGI